MKLNQTKIADFAIKSFVSVIPETNREKALALVGGNCGSGDDDPPNINNPDDWDEIDKWFDSLYDEFCHTGPDFDPNEYCEDNSYLQVDEDGNVEAGGWGQEGHYLDFNNPDHNDKNMDKSEWEQFKSSYGQ